MKPVRFHPEAQVELVAEAKYYEERSAGLGKRFLRDMEVAIGLASAFPDIGAPYRYGTRRMFPKSFRSASSTARSSTKSSSLRSLHFLAGRATGMAA